MRNNLFTLYIAETPDGDTAHTTRQGAIEFARLHGGVVRRIEMHRMGLSRLFVALFNKQDYVETQEVIWPEPEVETPPIQKLSFRAAVSDDDVAVIRATYVFRKTKMGDLAKRFRVSQYTIWKVINKVHPYE